MKAPAGIEHRLFLLRKLDDTALQAEYRRLYRLAAPKELRRDWLETAVGYQLQKALISKLRHRIQQIASAAEAITTAISTISDQTLLIREWRGQCHVVTVMDDGLMYQGEMYRSLSAVARVITGKAALANRLFGTELTGERVTPGNADGS